jgi:hypothetical protein
LDHFRFLQNCSGILHQIIWTANAEKQVC